MIQQENFWDSKNEPGKGRILCDKKKDTKWDDPSKGELDDSSNRTKKAYKLVKDQTMAKKEILPWSHTKQENAHWRTSHSR